MHSENFQFSFKNHNFTDYLGFYALKETNMARKAQNKKKYTFIDLFAGCGGLSEGFLESGQFEPLAHVEWELPMVNTLRNRLSTHWNYTEEEARKSVILFDIQKAPLHLQPQTRHAYFSYLLLQTRDSRIPLFMVQYVLSKDKGIFSTHDFSASLYLYGPSVWTVFSHWTALFDLTGSNSQLSTP